MCELDASVNDDSFDSDDTKDVDLTGLSPMMAFSVLQRRQSQQVEVCFILLVQLMKIINLVIRLNF